MSKKQCLNRKSQKFPEIGGALHSRRVTENFTALLGVFIRKFTLFNDITTAFVPGALASSVLVLKPEHFSWNTASSG